MADNKSDAVQIAKEVSVDDVSAMVASLDEKWSQFQRAFDTITHQVARSLGAVETREPLTPEAQRAVFGGQRPSLALVADRIRKGGATNIICLCGAGISTSAGIPDFRTPGTGLYDNLQMYNLPTPQAIFDMEYFRDHPEPFYQLASDIWPGDKYHPTTTHQFLKLLSNKGILRAIYTQNIDGLERLVGIPPDQLVECHGTFSTSRCIQCGVEASSNNIISQLRQDKGYIPRCQVDTYHSGVCGGLLKPDIVFFGESLPANFAERCNEDFQQCDMLLVLGTSLEVTPVSTLPNDVALDVPRVLFNRDRVGPFECVDPNNYRDVWVEGDCDAGVRRLCQLTGWDEMLHTVPPVPHRRRSVRGRLAARGRGATRGHTKRTPSVSGTRHTNPPVTRRRPTNTVPRVV